MWDKALGTLNWAGTAVIGRPLLVTMMVVFIWLLNRIQTITGLERDDLRHPGKTGHRPVRSQ